LRFCPVTCTKLYFFKVTGRESRRLGLTVDVVGKDADVTCAQLCTMEITASRKRMHIVHATSSNELKKKQNRTCAAGTAVREPSFAPLSNIIPVSNRYNPLARGSAVG
jgi:hypothetical protein